MSLTKRYGRWYVYGSEYVDGKQRRKLLLVTDDRAAAETADLAERLRKRTAARLTPIATPLAAYCERWMTDYAAQQVRARTLEGYRGLIDRYIVPTLGDVPLGDLVAAHVSKLLTAMRQHAPRTRLHAYTLLSQILRYAVRQGHLAANPCDRVKPPAVPRTERLTLSLDEARRMLAEVPPTPAGLLIALVLATGCRRSELCGLQWGDIDWEGSAIVIQRGLHRGATRDAAPRLEPPKSVSSRRRIAVLPDALARLRAHHAAQPDGPWVFGGEEPLHPEALGAAARYWLLRWARPELGGRAATKRGLRGITLHGLRHTHATLLMAANVHPKVVAERLGHSTTAITLDLYSHVRPGMDEAAAAALTALHQPASTAASTASPEIVPGEAV